MVARYLKEPKSLPTAYDSVKECSDPRGVIAVANQLLAGYRFSEDDTETTIQLVRNLERYAKCDVVNVVDASNTSKTIDTVTSRDLESAGLRALVGLESCNMRLEKNRSNLKFTNTQLIPALIRYDPKMVAGQNANSLRWLTTLIYAMTMEYAYRTSHTVELVTLCSLPINIRGQKEILKRFNDVKEMLISMRNGCHCELDIRVMQCLRQSTSATKLPNVAF